MRKTIELVVLVLLCGTTLLFAAGSKEGGAASSKGVQPSSTGTKDGKSLSIDPSDQVKLTFLWQAAKTPKFAGTPIGDEITARTGVKIEFVPTIGDANQFHDVMLASKEFPDLVGAAQGTQVGRYMEAGAFIEIEGLMKKYAPTYYSLISMEQNGNLVQVYKNMYNGKLHFWGNSGNGMVNRPGEKPIVDFFSDSYTAKAVGEEMGASQCYVLFPDVQQFTNKKPQTLNEVYDLYKKYMQQYGGDRTHYAVSTYLDASADLLKMALRIYGYKENSGLYKKDGSSAYIFPFFAPEVPTFMRFLNKLYREGFMDPEGPLQTEENYIAQLSKGNIFSHLGSWYQPMKVNINLAKTEDIFIPFKIMEPEANGKYYYENKATIGFKMMGVTTSCKRPDKAMQFLEWFMADPSAPILVGWGFKDKDYIINAKGQPDLNQEIVNSHKGEYYYEMGMSPTGPVSWFWALCMVPDRTVNGTPWRHGLSDFSLNSSMATDPRDAVVMKTVFDWHANLRGTFYYDNGLKHITIGPSDQKQIALDTANNYIKDAVMRMIMAKSDAELTVIYNETSKNMVAAGIDKYVKYMNDNYKTR